MTASPAVAEAPIGRTAQTLLRERWARQVAAQGKALLPVFGTEAKVGEGGEGPNVLGARITRS